MLFRSADKNDNSKLPTSKQSVTATKKDSSAVYPPVYPPVYPGSGSAASAYGSSSSNSNNSKNNTSGASGKVNDVIYILKHFLPFLAYRNSWGCSK